MPAAESVPWPLFHHPARHAKHAMARIRQRPAGKQNLLFVIEHQFHPSRSWHHSMRRQVCFKKPASRFELPSIFQRHHYCAFQLLVDCLQSLSIDQRDLCIAWPSQQLSSSPPHQSLPQQTNQSPIPWTTASSPTMPCRNSANRSSLFTRAMKSKFAARIAKRCSIKTRTRHWPDFRNSPQKTPRPHRTDS